MSEHAQRIDDVPNHFIQPSPAPRLPGVLAQKQGTTQRASRRRGVASLVCLHLEVKAELVVEIILK